MSYKRRDFLKTATVLTSGIALTAIGSKLTGCKTAAASGGTGNLNAYGLQLYTLRDDLPKDPKGILKRIADFGYKQIEGYEGKDGMFWGMTNKDFEKYLNDLGMKMVSSHCDMNKDFERKADEAAAIGMKYLICPYLGPQKEMDAFKKAAERFNQCGDICKQRGMRFAYHNHDYSFKPIDGQLPQDVMMQSTNADTVDYEMDIYWVVAAGQDPVSWFNKYPNRFRLCHVKDRKGEESTILGTGNIDFPTILKEAQKQGMQYFIVEQEAYTGTTPIAAVQADAEYMKKLKI
jgi:sugar phosphate isomerase/epimerase